RDHAPMVLGALRAPVATPGATYSRDPIERPSATPFLRGVGAGLRSSHQQPDKEAQMHAVVVRVTIHNADPTRGLLNSQVVPQVSGGRGFKAGYWTWSTGGGELNGLSMIIFDSEENARAAGELISAIAASAPDAVTFDGAEVREVVASA